MTITANYFGRMTRTPTAAPKSLGDVELQSLGLTKCPGAQATQDCSNPGFTGPAAQDLLRARRKHQELIKQSQVNSGSSSQTGLNRNQALAILTKIRWGLHADSNNHRTLTQLIKTLQQSRSVQLSLEIWAGMSLTLERLLGQPLPDYAKVNLRYLELVSRYSWAQLAHDHLVNYFAGEIERYAVENPVMQDCTGMRAALELTTPVKVLSVGTELRYMQSKAVDDEGNYVSTQMVSGSLTCNLKALFCSLKGKVTVSAGAYTYGRTGQDYARHMFAQLVADNRQLPGLARYLSRAGATGQLPAEPEEISDFEHLKDTYLLQQKAISKSFSVLLSLATTKLESQANDQAQPQINLQVVPLAKPKMTQGITTAKTVGVQGSAGLSLLQAGLKTEATTKNVTTGREATLCELLQNQYPDRAFKAKMKQDIVIASAKVRNSVLAFWYGENAPANAQVIQAGHIDQFTRDWNYYRHLHAMQCQGHAGVGASIDAFHQKYRAKNTRECLCAMALLMADFYARLLDQDDSAQCDQMKSAVQQLEQQLHLSSIPHAREILSQQSLARQQIDYSSNEKIVQFSVGCTSQADSGNPGAKITFRTLHHYNSLRWGDEVTVELTIGDSLEQNRQLLKLTGDYLSGGASGLQVNFGVDTFSTQGVYIVRYFRPKMFVGLPFAKLFERRVVQTNRQFSVSAALPLAGALGLRASLSGTQTGNQLVSETPGSETLLYFAKHYLHALSSGKADRSGKVVPGSYWYRLERRHSTALQQMLLNLARHSREKTGLSLELDAIERALLQSEAEQSLCAASRQKMLSLAQQLERAGTPENYRLALAGFKQYLVTILPYWQRDKENSSAYKKWQYKI